MAQEIWLEVMGNLLVTVKYGLQVMHDFNAFLPVHPGSYLQA
jgi:hypothetical protein